MEVSASQVSKTNNIVIISIVRVIIAIIVIMIMPLAKAALLGLVHRIGSPRPKPQTLKPEPLNPNP